jgi:CheY-like chemotaxis protein
MRMQAHVAFPGATSVCDAICFMAASRGGRRVLIGSPRLDDAMRLGGYLVKLGYEFDTATTGREVLRKALESPDYELILVDAILSYPTVDALVQSLRRDGRTGLLPVGVLAVSGDLERATRLVRNDRRARAYPRPHNEETARWQIEDLMTLSGDTVSAAERTRQAALALDWLAQLTRPDAEGLYDLSRVGEPVFAALGVPGLSGKACAVLGNLGTPEAQEALIDLASRKTSPLAERKAALEAFRTAVQRRGLSLTTAKIQLQYDRYNQSAKDDSATQAVLGKILDCIEAPTKPQKQARRRTEGDVPHMARGGQKP